MLSWNHAELESIIKRPRHDRLRDFIAAVVRSRAAQLEVRNTQLGAHPKLFEDIHQWSPTLAQHEGKGLSSMIIADDTLVLLHVSLVRRAALQSSHLAGGALSMVTTEQNCDSPRLPCQADLQKTSKT